MVRTSIVMATRNKCTRLQKTLESIRKQKPSVEYELVVVDDGSTDKTLEVCTQYKVDKYIRLDNKVFRNPSVARNTGYKAASGEIIIAQSDDVIHITNNSIERLTLDLKHGEFIIATVWNYFFEKRKRGVLYTGLGNQRPFFFLGSLWRKDLYAVGGNDEEFTTPGFDDDWFGDCLIKGLGLKCIYSSRIEGHHQDHERSSFQRNHSVSKGIYEKKIDKAKKGEILWQASGGPWFDRS